MSGVSLHFISFSSVLLQRCFEHACWPIFGKQHDGACGSWSAHWEQCASEGCGNPDIDNVFRHLPPVLPFARLTFFAQTHYKDAAVGQVNVPGITGSFGILPDHVPVLTTLKPGVVDVMETAGGAAESFFVSSGTVTVNTVSPDLSFRG